MDRGDRGLGSLYSLEKRLVMVSRGWRNTSCIGLNFVVADPNILGSLLFSYIDRVWPTADGRGGSVLRRSEVGGIDQSVAVTTILYEFSFAAGAY